MGTLFWILIYLIGVALSIGRHIAINYQWYEDADILYDEYEDESAFESIIEPESLIHLFSWCTFVVLTFEYLTNDNKYFIKYSFKGLRNAEYNKKK